MRFFHISDLHIGKQLNGINLTEDLRHILFGQVLGSAYRQFSPDALIIAGDIYDKASPSAEGVALFDEFLSQAAALGLPVYAISGNHDNALRVSYGRNLFSHSKIYLCSPFSAQTPVTVYPCGNIDIALLPHISAQAAAAAFPEDDIQTVTDAVKAAFRHGEIPREGRPCLLVAHQSVAGSADSAIGGAENCDYHAFGQFCYTALGHLHNPHFVGGNKVRYSGSPLCFSAREASCSPQKYLDIIDITDDGETEVTQHPLQPLHPVRSIEDSFDNLLSDKYSSTEDYVFISVKGQNTKSDSARQLMIKFPNCVSIRYDEQRTGTDTPEEYTSVSFEELFSGFFRFTAGEEIDPEALKEAGELYAQAEKEGSA